MSGGAAVLNGITVSLFGSILAASFCGALSDPRNRRVFWCCIALLPLLQGGACLLWEMELLRKLYPLMVHLPLMLILWGLTQKLFWAIISVLFAYLCCQLRRWLALLTVLLLDGGSMLQDITELLLTLPLLWVLLRFVSPAVHRLAEYPAALQLQFGVLPAVYYIFDYATVVYTNLLSGGSSVVLEFMPFVCCAAYLIFLVVLSREEERRLELQQAKDVLNLQLDHSVREIAALQESQNQTRRYRHDLRHHLQYVSSCIENGQAEQAQTYISRIFEEIEAQKVRQYCENESANLILSAYANRAEKEGVEMEVEGRIPPFLLVSDSDLCVLLSNGLENALHACLPLTAKGERCTIEVRMYERERKLFLQITNPCGEVRLEQGIPVTDRPGHGIGVKSICAITEKYGGMYSFQIRDHRFVLRVSL